MKKFFETRLKVYEHEFNEFLWMAVIFTAVFFITAIFRNYVDTTFLKRYGVGQIPLMYVLNGFLTIAVLGCMNRLGEKFPDHGLLAGFLAVYGVLAAILYFMVEQDISIAYAFLFQMLHLLDSVFLVYLWNIACDLFDARQGKRIFPLIIACQVFGTAVGNFSTGWLGHAVDQNLPLMVFSPSCLIIAFSLARSAARMMCHAKLQTAGTENNRKKLAEIPAILKKYPIVRYLCIIGLIPNILLPIFAYQFNVIADSTFASEQSLITFLGFFRGSMTVAVFFLLFIMGRAYARIGVVNASLVYPVNFTLIFGALTLFFNIYTAALGQFSIRLVQQAVAGPVGKVLFNTVPREIALWSRVFVRGTVIKVGMILGSLLMLGLKPICAPRWLAPIAAGIALCWMAEVLLFRRRYRTGLKQAIIGERIDFDRMDLASVATDALHTETVPHSVRENPHPEPSGFSSLPVIPVEAALKLLGDPDELTRAEAAAIFGRTRDPGAIRRLIRLLDDREVVRRAASEALINYGEALLPFVEAVLGHSSPIAQQSLLEVMRMSNLKDFDVFPFLGKQVCTAYDHIHAGNVLSDGDDSPSTRMLKAHLQDQNDAILSLVFHALWVNHADMGLMYEALRSAEAPVAVEMVEATLDRDLAKYLIPLIDNIPAVEKVRLGRKILPLMRAASPERVLARLAWSGDGTTRMLTAFTIGARFPYAVFIPTLEELVEDGEADVRQTANYALKRCLNEEAEMPEVIELIDELRNFILFDGMGLKELRAIASIVVQEQFRPGDILMREGEDNSSLYLLVKGQVKLYQGYGTAEEGHKATLGAGAFMGELRLFTELPAATTCMVTEATEALIIHKHHFHEIMRIYPQIGINLSLFFALRLAAAEMKPDFQ
jgi:hypothetical protein